jgi:purine-binding chemotaxis protein CheW
VEKTEALFVFLLDDQRYGLRLSTVERVERMVETTPLPQAPHIVLGIVNLRGRIVPVFNVRRRFGLREREPDPNDHLVIANTSRRTVALAVDEPVGAVEKSIGEVVDKSAILPGIGCIEGVAKSEDGMILIHDLDRFLSIQEENSLEDAMAMHKGAGR